MKLHFLFYVEIFRKNHLKKAKPNKQMRLLMVKSILKMQSLSLRYIVTEVIMLCCETHIHDEYCFKIHFFNISKRNFIIVLPATFPCHFILSLSTALYPNYMGGFLYFFVMRSTEIYIIFLMIHRNYYDIQFSLTHSIFSLIFLKLI